MTTRTVGATTYTQGWDAENRLVTVSGTGLSSTFSYDGDGVRVKGTVNGAATAYVGNWFEWSGSTSTMKKYDYAGAQRIAMRTGSGTGTSGLLWIIGDHLGSTTKIRHEYLVLPDS
jgi:YD repeat-containing protein